MSGKPLILGLLLLLMGSGCTFPLRGQDNEPPVPVYRDSLNVYITNELSEIPELQPMDVAIDSFMDFWTLHGVSLAIVRNDSLVYAKGYGKADASTPMTPGTTLRMASVSKLLTAIGIMKLQEEGKLFLDTPVFGPLGILGKYDSYIKDDNYYLITIEHLLRHQAGFTTRGGDPVFSPWTDLDALLKKQLGRRLSYEPGTWQEYSNFGFLLLSLVIEEVSGQSYESFMQQKVFEPNLCHGFSIGGNYLADRHPGESRYYMQPDAEKMPSFDGKYALVEKCYGGNNVTGSQGAGGWTGSTVEMARMVALIDGCDVLPDILSAFTVDQMTHYLDPDTYSLGWNDTKPTGEWTRSGSFSGTQALVKVYPDGECWILFSNTSAWRGSRFANNINALFTNLRSRFSAALPHRDLFQE